MNKKIDGMLTQADNAILVVDMQNDWVLPSSPLHVAGDNNVNEVETVDTYVVFETSFREDLFFIDFQILDKEVPYLAFDFFTFHFVILLIYIVI